MWDLDYKESWAWKNWCFWTVVLEKTLASPLNCKEIKPVHPKGNQAWIFMGRTNAETETPILWPLDGKNWLIWKDPDAGKDWRREEKGTTEDEMAGRHHWLDGREFEWTPGVGDGQGVLACCNSWGRKESDMTERLNWTEQALLITTMGFLGNTSGQESTCHLKRHCFDLWAGKIPWRRKWQPTPVFLPRKFHGQRSLAGYNPWGHRVGHDWVTERTHTQ